MEKIGEFDLNKVYLMDALDFLKKLPNESIDAFVIDPPYYIQNMQEDLKDSTLRKSSKNNIFCADWDSNFEDLEFYKHFMYKTLKSMKRVLKAKGQVYMFFSYHHLDWCIDMVKKLGYRYYKPLIWYKPDTMGVFPNQYGCNYEVILWFRNDKKGGDVKLNIGCSQRDVFVKNSTNNKYRKECDYHPTPKPKEIIKRLIKNCSDENDIICDLFMGSGTTAVSCKELNRKFTGCELNEAYLKTINKRLSQETLDIFTHKGTLF